MAVSVGRLGDWLLRGDGCADWAGVGGREGESMMLGEKMLIVLMGVICFVIGSVMPFIGEVGEDGSISLMGHPKYWLLGMGMLIFVIMFINEIVLLIQEVIKARLESRRNVCK
jgi:hypothetical protein